MTFLGEWTEEDQARLDAREAAQRTEALAVLRTTLIADGLAPHVAARVLVTVERVLHPRIEKSHGVLSDGGMLSPVHTYFNPYGRDTEMPGWQQYEDMAAAASAAARDYQIVRLSTGWIERTT